MRFRINNTNTILILGVIAIAAFISYSQSLNADFKTMDDYASIVENADIKDISNIGAIFTKSFFGGRSYYRPLVSLSFMAEYFFFGLEPFYYYLDNLLLHILTSFVLFFLMRTLLKRTSSAFFVALIFAVHPINWEVVSNIPGRSMLLCAFFHLLSLFFFVRRRTPYALAAFSLSLLSKESAIVLPAVVLAYTWINEDGPGRARRSFQLTWPFFLLSGLYFAWRAILKVSNVFIPRPVGQILLEAATFFKGVLLYSATLLFPSNLYYDKMLKVPPGFANASLIATLLFYAVVAFLLVKFRKRFSRLGVFWGAWFLLELFPVSQIVVPIRVQAGYISFADHFFYISSICFFILLVNIFERVYAFSREKELIDRRFLNFLVVGLIGFLAIGTINQSIYSSNEIAMYERSLKHNPENARIITSLGLSYAKNKMFIDAEEKFREALTINPADTRARISLGKVYVDQQRYWEGLQQYDQVTRAEGMEDLLSQNAQAVYRILIKKYAKIVDEQPRNSQAHYSLGVVYSKSGQILKAIREFETAIQLNSYYRAALFNLASLLEVKGQLETAAGYYQRLLHSGKREDELDQMARQALARIKTKTRSTR